MSKRENYDDMSKWENYGDINPIEHGGVFVKHDDEVSGRCYYVISLQSTEEGNWQLIDGYIDLDDSWIDKEAVIETCGRLEPHDDDESLVVDCMWYYGTNLSNGVLEVIGSREEVVERIKNYGIEINN